MDDLSRRIAAKVKQLRAEKHLSLEALAQTASVSRSMLSLIERAETAATAVVLEKIAAALGVPLATLFDAEEAPKPLIKAAERSVWTDPDTGYRRSNISPPGVEAPFQLVEVFLPPGCRVAFDGDASRPAFHHQIWLLEGTLTISDGAARYVLEAGDCLAIAAGPCVFVNPGKTASRHMVAICRTPGH